MQTGRVQRPIRGAWWSSAQTESERVRSAKRLPASITYKATDFMKTWIYLLIALSATTYFSSCKINTYIPEKQQENSKNKYIAIYKNGWVTDLNGKVIATYANGYVLNTNKEVVATYSNGYVLNLKGTVFATYRNGFVFD